MNVYFKRIITRGYSMKFLPFCPFVGHKRGYKRSCACLVIYIKYTYIVNFKEQIYKKNFLTNYLFMTNIFLWKEIHFLSIYGILYGYFTRGRYQEYYRENVFHVL